MCAINVVFPLIMEALRRSVFNPFQDGLAEGLAAAAGTGDSRPVAATQGGRNS